jgi:hypothetical protein
MVMTAAGARPRRLPAHRDRPPALGRRCFPPPLAGGAAVFVTAWLLAAAPAAAWRTARIEPHVDNLEELLGACEKKREEALDRNRGIDEWVAYKAGLGEDVSKQATKGPVPSCDPGSISARLAAGAPAVWAMTAADGQLYATVNLPLPGILVSTDGGSSWHYRHLFVGGYNVDRGFLLRGVAYRDGLLAVASETGVLLSADGGRSFDVALAGKPFWAVAISPASKQRLVAGGDGTSFLSEDGGRTWTDLGFSRFTADLRTRNPHRVDHITSVAFDPDDGRTLYAGTGSHLYRFVSDSAPAAEGRWQAMEGNAAGRVLDDSTVYNIEIGERFMISTCNGVYYVDELGADTRSAQADVSWKKFRDSTFSKRSVGGPKGNLRAYFVAEDPADRERVLVADFAALYEGTGEGGQLRWKRIEELPYGSQVAGYPEYTAIAWTRSGRTVVGSRYRGIFVQDGARGVPDAGPSCVLR